MKKFAPVFLTILMATIVAKGQSTLFDRIDSLDKRPLVIINGKVADALSFLALDKQDFQDFKIFTPEEAKKKFGISHGRFGAVQITLVKTAKIFKWSQLAARFYFIPKLMPVKAKILYGYFGGLEFNDPRLFITSVSTPTSMGINLKDYQTGKPMVSVGIENNKNNSKYKAAYGPFDKDIDAIKQIFDKESVKRVEIENAKPRLEG